MRRLVAVGVALAAWSTATAGHAAWNDTRWGMDRAQLQALYPDLRAKIDGYTRGTFDMSRTVKPFAGLSWDEADFIVGDIGLNQVVLATPAPLPQVQAAFQKLYGPPRVSERNAYIERYTYRDPKSGDEIMLQTRALPGALVQIRPTEWR